MSVYEDKSTLFNPKFHVSNHLAVQAGLCQTWSGTPKTSFLAGPGVWRRSVRAYDSESRGSGFDPQRWHLVVSLSKTH